MRKKITIRFAGGLDFEPGMREILSPVSSQYEFVESDNPDFVVFGPYGGIVPQGRFTRIGYYCESMKPDMNVCDWAFGMPYEEQVNHPRYARITWHGFDPSLLVKDEVDVDRALSTKTKFCSFIYSNPVPFREAFCKRLQAYKPVDCPGRSLNNIPGIDPDSSDGSSMWERKRRFLSQYKFTIAFENYSYPGYNTEKILDPMVAGSIPIYWGNPLIDRHFNTASFVNAHDYIQANKSRAGRVLESACQRTLDDFESLPAGITSEPFVKMKRKLKARGRDLKVQLEYGMNFDSLINRIIEIDRDDHLYARYLQEPWFTDNTPPSDDHIKQRWMEIFGD